MLSFLAAHPDCFERSLPQGHFTASAWLLNPDGSKALMMHHAKLKEWFQLGGHCDGDPDILAVALKEAREESGLDQIKPLLEGIFDLDIHLIPENPKESAHYHYDVRFLLQADSETVKINRESKQLLWIDSNLSSLPTKNVSIVRMFQKWRKYLRLSI
jgi:8-oxo-dGTP pyrophosphatase MutT (NUDIX family)